MKKAFFISSHTATKAWVKSIWLLVRTGIRGKFSFHAAIDMSHNACHFSTTQRRCSKCSNIFIEKKWKCLVDKSKYKNRGGKTIIKSMHALSLFSTSKPTSYEVVEFIWEKLFFPRRCTVLKLSQLWKQKRWRWWSKTALIMDFAKPTARVAHFQKNFLVLDYLSVAAVLFFGGMKFTSHRSKLRIFQKEDQSGNLRK